MPGFGLGFGLGIGCGGVGIAAPSIPLSFWTSGGYWDLSKLSGNPGDPVTTTIASSTGSNVLTPMGGLSINDTAIGGIRTLTNVYANGNMLRCDALASQFTKGNTWTVAVRYRSQGSLHPSPIFSGGHSTTAVHDFFQISQSTLGICQVISDTLAGGTITRTGSTQLNYDDHIIVVWSDGTTIFVNIDGVTETLDNALLDTNANVMDRFAFGGVFSTAGSNFLDGYIQKCAMSTSAFSTANAIILNNQWRAGDFTVTKSACTQYIWIGDSITETSINTQYGAGFREYVLQWIVDNGLSLHAVGLRNGGTVPDRLNEAQGGANLATILANSQSAAGTAGINPRFGLFMGGTNNMAGNTTAIQLAAWRSTAQGIQTAFVAKDSAFRLITTTIPSVETGTSPADTNVPLFNTGLQAAGTGEFDFFDSQNPSNHLIRYDAYAALGSAWSLTYWDAWPIPDGVGNTTHPNEIGCQVAGAAQVVAAGLYMRSQSATIVPLKATITSPLPGATLTTGTVYPINVQVSRYPSTVVIKKNGVSIGSATMNKLSGTINYTAISGDIGTLSFTAVVTDSLDNTTATSAAVSTTVAAPSATPLTIISSGTVVPWVRADLGITTVSGAVSLWADQGSGGKNYAQASGTLRPTYNTTDATLSNLATMTFDGATSVLNIASIALTAPYTIYLIMKPIAWTSGSYFFGSSAEVAARLLFTSASPKMEMQGSSLANLSNGVALGSWARVRAKFTNSTSDKFKAGSATEVTGANAGSVVSTMLTLGRFSNIAVREVVIVNAVTSGAEDTAMDNYFAAQSASILL